MAALGDSARGRSLGFCVSFACLSLLVVLRNSSSLELVLPEFKATLMLSGATLITFVLVCFRLWIAIIVFTIFEIRMIAVKS